ncbi:IPT/TIG domain-containing protein [Hymenobacter sp. ASUV-10]|uniref:IPT/TIG domain-containing protein n=1 Tax=Hymenobacter aranciens TaxID=3063996 RepID=A0ABT9BEN8_9BACT|nr:IPT/TIG domain-containing protein [Hymenobacter sp. ASUV-10]MDO7876235.1 IPT/TIG domain-containing protein [Hymenobacter sp. ASUV-10]
MTRFFTTRLLACLSMLLLWSGLASAAPFTPGNLVVVRVGDAVTAPASGVAAATFLLEYTPTGTLVQTIALPTATSGTNRSLTNTTSSSSEGYLSRSADGRYLLVPGYDAVPGTAALVATASTATNRVIGRVAADGSIDTSTRIDDAFSAGNIRSVASADGANFYASGSNSGVRYLPLGNTGPTTAINTTPTNLRVLSIYGGNLYVSAATGAFQGISQVGTGLPTTTGQTVTLLPGFPTASGPQPYAFYFADLSATVPGVDVVYVADDRTATPGGVQKWSLVGGTWTLNGSILSAATSPLAVRGITGQTTGTTVSLGVSGNGGLYFFSDATGYNVAPAITTLPAPIATAGGNGAVFRGVAFAPEAATTTAPTIASFTPTTGAAGATVTLTGTNLTGATAVTLNGVAITGYTVVNATTITFVLPTGATSGTIAVTTPGGTATSTGSFTVTVATPAPTITSFTPATGPAGTVVTVTGTNFTGATGATINGTAGTSFMVMSATEVMFTVPAGATSGTIAVTTAGGTATSTGTFTVTTPTAAPTIASFSPATAAVGATVTLTGTNLTGATAVTLNGVAITGYTVVNATTITFVLPTGAASGPIAVTTPGGTATSSTSFTVTTPSTGNFIEDFELGTRTTNYNGTTPLALTTGNWTFVEALIGDLANDKKNGAKAARIRGGGTITMEFDKPNGAGVISLQAATFGNDTGASFTLSISTDGGSTFTPIAGTPATLNATLTPYTFTVNQTGNIRLRIGTTNTAAAANPRINIDDVSITDASAPTTATLTAAPATLPAFSTVVGTPSTSQSFAITGVVLTADATITAPAGYEVSLSAAGPYTASVTVSPTSGSIASTTIYVRLTGAAIGTPAGNVTVASTGATTQNVAVTGTVTATAPVAPTITSFTPTTGAAGATVTITGTNLTGATAVTLNGVAITGFTVVDGNTITFVVPASAATGTIAVTTPGGTATSTSTFTVTPTATVPVLSTISPVRAVVGGPGFVMTLTGTGFTATTQVTIGTNTYTAATVNAGATSITINVPASQIATIGQFPITANNGGAASAVRDFFVVPAATSLAYEDFEAGTKAASGYSAGPVTLRSGEWNFTEALLGDLFNDRVNQVRAARIRGGGSIAMNFDKPDGAGVITVQAAMYGTDTPTTFTVEISTNGGTTYTVLPGAPTVLTTTLTTYSFVANVTGNVRLRISTAAPTGNTARINIDDINIPNFLATNPGSALPGLALYPNPAQDRLTVSLPTAGAATVALRDLTGRVVLAEAPLAANGVVTLPASLATGTYLLEVRQNGVTAVRRVAKN